MDNIRSLNTPKQNGMSKQDQSDLRKAIERLMVLTGETGPADGSQRAVRRGELDDIKGLSAAKTTAVQLTIAPTAADYNLLLADVAKICLVLQRVAVAFSK